MSEKQYLSVTLFASWHDASHTHYKAQISDSDCDAFRREDARVYDSSNILIAAFAIPCRRNQ